MQFSVICWTFVAGILPLCKDVVSIFYNSNQLGCLFEWFFYKDEGAQSVLIFPIAGVEKRFMPFQSALVQSEM